MTKEQVLKHGEVIKWFVDNVDKGVWARDVSNENIIWGLNKNPNWFLDYTYIQNDSYSELRMAQADGKVIQSNVYKEKYGHSWSLSNDWRGDCLEFVAPLNMYRIKPDEPKFKVGDWMVNKATEASFGKKASKPLLVEQDWLDHIKKYGKTYGGNTAYTGNLENFELWQPTEGEWCVFWSDNIAKYRIARYRDKPDHRHRGYKCGLYSHVAPLEFALTLKDK